MPTPAPGVQLDQLRTFIDVAAAGSFSRAATLSGSTQSSISKRILALERALGSRLFDRTGRGALLTQAGRVLLSRAESLIADTDRLPELVAESIAQPRGHVRVAIQQSVSWPLVGHLYRRVATTFPGIRLEISEATMKQIDEWLRDGRIDVGVLSKLPQEAAAGEIPLFAPTMHLIGAPGDPQTRGRTIDFARAAKLPLIVPTLSNAVRVLVEEQARRLGIELNVVLEINSMYLTRRMVTMRAGYAVISRKAIVDELQAGVLSASRIVRPEIVQRFHLAIASARGVAPAVRVVADLLRRASRMHGPAPSAGTRGALPRGFVQ